jgi:predicted metal-binding membrane protein
VAWAFAGVIAFFGLALFEQVLVLAGSNAGWLGAAIFVTAGVYQPTSFKDVCLRHCRSPMSLLLHYTSFRGPAIDLRVGFHHGLYCVACCWGLMLILVAVGVMNIPAMAALTIVIFAEKLLRHGLLIARLIRYLFLRCSDRCGDFSQPLSRSEAVLHSSTVTRIHEKRKFIHAKC